MEPHEHQGDQSSNGSIPAEVVQEEVKRQVQHAMQSRDNCNSALQAENQELKQLLMEMIEMGPRNREPAKKKLGWPPKATLGARGSVEGRLPQRWEETADRILLYYLYLPDMGTGSTWTCAK